MTRPDVYEGDDGMPDDFLTLTDAARRERVPRQTLSRLVKDGKLTTHIDIFDTRRKLVRAEDVRALRQPRPRTKETAVSAA
jgi:hypothetical protein